MSDAIPPNLDLQEQVVRIDRAIEESHKFTEESRKFAAEQYKLIADGARKRQEIRFAPWALALSGATAGAALFAAGAAFMKLLG